jgi:hypothetical protein
MSDTAYVTGGKPIAVWSQSNSDVNAINPVVAFYDIHGRKREVPSFIFARTPHETFIITYHTLIVSLLRAVVWAALLVLPAACKDLAEVDVHDKPQAQDPDLNYDDYSPLDVDDENGNYRSFCCSC